MLDQDTENKRICKLPQMTAATQNQYFTLSILVAGFKNLYSVKKVLYDVKKNNILKGGGKCMESLTS